MTDTLRGTSPSETAAGGLADLLTVVLLTHDCAHRVEPVARHLVELGVPVLAVDNASTDGTPDLLERLGVRVLRNPVNTGAAGRNVGAEAATTPYVAFCDDDGWYERDGLEQVVAVMERHPRLGLVNTRIVVEPDGRLDPISAEMAASPLPDTAGVPGAVLLSFMAGAAVVRRDAYLAVGGYDPRFFLGGEEETVAMKLARAGWEMRYLPDAVMHHAPSRANAPWLRAHGLRNTLWNAWLHRRAGSALRYSAFVLADTPKNADWVRGVAMTLGGLPWVLRRRRPMDADLDERYAVLDRRRFAGRRPFWTFTDPIRRLRRTGRTPVPREGRPT